MVVSKDETRCDEVDPITEVRCGIKDQYHVVHSHDDGFFVFKWRVLKTPAIAKE